MTSVPTSASRHRWNFFRTGGLDQVALTTGADLLALETLDQKLWVALSCPVKGIELDEKTLALIDTDNDGHIRVPEILAAVKWAAARLRDPGDLLRGTDPLPLSSINEATPEGKILVASARQILASLDRGDAGAVTVAEAADAAKILAAKPPIGDGIITLAATDDAAVQALIKDIIATVGGTPMHTGAIGVTAEQIEKFFKEIADYAEWVEKSAAQNVAVLGVETEAAVHALKAVRAKIDDFFGRCRLAAFDARAVAALNRSETEYLAVAAKDLNITAAEVSGFPLARIEGNRPLPLRDGVNPAWGPAIKAFVEKTITPILGAEKTTLNETEWQAINARLAPYEAWLGSKPASAVEKLPLDRVREILRGKVRPALDAIVARDRELGPQFRGISDVERLARYHRDLRTLLHNFINFADFYSPERWAVFQAGTLFFDSRSTELCIRVADVGAHAAIAAMSKAYIAYLDCHRTGGETMKLAACVTQGDSDYLFVGRNGIFYGRDGRDWDATITRIVDNPISIRQAFWSPYKKFIRMIEEQVAKRAAAADAASSANLQTAAAAVALAAQKTPPGAPPAPVPPPPVPPKKMDVGTVAALGVALGSIMTFFSVIFAKFIDLPAWQLPLVVIGIILAISIPSMVIAWLKLRQRTVGPLLEANGWAINGRVKINIPFGTKLTERAVLPAGSHLTRQDPYEDKAAAFRRRLFTVLFVLMLAGVGAAYWFRTWPFKPAPAAATPAAAAAK
ncbi:MAG TPA: hypothetical protein VHO24_08420 [Opitutaceae bacterium]|nr:hypothetical protein [Opitutaceae bacterium]